MGITRSWSNAHPSGDGLEQCRLCVRCLGSRKSKHSSNWHWQAKVAVNDHQLLPISVEDGYCTPYPKLWPSESEVRSFPISFPFQPRALEGKLSGRLGSVKTRELRWSFRSGLRSNDRLTGPSTFVPILWLRVCACVWRCIHGHGPCANPWD